jgi:hypothetical protein
MSSQKEFDTLAFLMRHPNTPIPHAKLRAVLWPRIPANWSICGPMSDTSGKKSTKIPPGPSMSLPNPLAGDRFRDHVDSDAPPFVGT